MEIIMQNFVLIGKASTVFRLIELKAKQEHEQQGSLCPFDPQRIARCNVTDPCGKVDCQIWREAIAKANLEMTNGGYTPNDRT
jgi:hypothetical protein